MRSRWTLYIRKKRRVSYSEGILYFEILLWIGWFGIFAGGVWWMAWQGIWRSEAKRVVHEVVMALQQAKIEAISRRQSLVLSLIPPGNLWSDSGWLRSYAWPEQYRFRSNYDQDRVRWTAQGVVRGGTIFIFVKGIYAGRVVLSVATSQVKSVFAWEEEEQ